jgi:hypothetical protein
VPGARDLQPTAAAAGGVSAAVSPPAATDRVRAEWRARIAAEYTSATITQHLVLWLMQAGAPPDLIDAGLVIVGDELVHSRMSHETYVAASGTTPPALDRDQLGLRSSGAGVELDILRVALEVFCLGETVAVPLFKHLREPCTVAPARAALDRILRDEVRHRDFGWDLLDWLAITPLAGAIGGFAARELPRMFARLDASYGRGNSAVARDDGAMTEAERAWGLAPPREYAEILARTLDKEWKPRFAARDIDVVAILTPPRPLEIP